MESRAEFSKDEIEAICALLDRIRKADRDEQKRLRGRIRKMGFYLSDWGGPGLTSTDVRGLLSRTRPTSPRPTTPLEPAPPGSSARSLPTLSSGRGRDESYVVDLCDELLKRKALRQHRFDWLLGDPGSTGARAKLPVDAYYPDLGLVVEYRERQHDEPTPFFDKVHRLTVSGVHRGVQRRLYDERRERKLPAHGLRLVVIKPADLHADRQGRLLRDRAHDVAQVRRLLGAASADD